MTIEIESERIGIRNWQLQAESASDKLIDIISSIFFEIKMKIHSFIGKQKTL